jgi:hypothetical protein
MPLEVINSAFGSPPVLATQATIIAIPVVFVTYSMQR